MASKIVDFKPTIDNHFKCLNASVKGRLLDWIQKEDSVLCCLWETHFKYKDIDRLK